MSRYAFAHAAIESTVQLPELIELPSSAPAIRFSFTDSAFDDGVHWYHELADSSGQKRISFGRVGTAYPIRFHGHADILARRIADGWDVTCAPRAGAAFETVRHLLVDQLVPLLLNGAGKVALHASAATTPGGTVAFTGPSGAGKSTMAAAFWALGDLLVADDVLLLAPSTGRPAAYPAHPVIRLWPDSASAVLLRCGPNAPPNDRGEKLRLGIAHGNGIADAKAVPVDAVYVLDRGRDCEHPSVEAMSRREAFRVLLGHVYRLDPFDREAITAEMDLLHRIVRQLPVRRLRLPTSFEALPAVRQLVIHDVRR